MYDEIRMSICVYGMQLFDLYYFYIFFIIFLFILIFAYKLYNTKI